MLMDALRRELERIAPACGGQLGVAVQQCGSSKSPVESLLNGGDPFPMASTFKVPLGEVQQSYLRSPAGQKCSHSHRKRSLWHQSLTSTVHCLQRTAVQLLRRVDAGELSMELLHTVLPSELHPGSGDLTSVQPAIRSCIRL